MTDPQSVEGTQLECPNCPGVFHDEDAYQQHRQEHADAVCDERHCNNIPSIVVEPIDGDVRREVCLDHAISAVDRIGQEVRHAAE